MAWTGFGGSWSNGVHQGGDSSGSIGGGGIALDGNGNPVGTHAPTASDIAAQYNGFGGAKISADQVSNIRSDGAGGFNADISGAEHSVSVNESTTISNTITGFTGVSASTGNGSNNTTVNGASTNAAASIRAGTIPPGYFIEGNKIGIHQAKYSTMSTGHGEHQQIYEGMHFVEIPTLTAAYKEGVDQRAELHDAIAFTAAFYQEVTSKISAVASAIAQKLAVSAVGKQVNGVDQALAIFNKYQVAITQKYSPADCEAIAKALESVDHTQLALHLSKFSKGLGFIGKGIDLFDIFAVALPAAIRTKDWHSFFVKAESVLLSSDATLVAAYAFSFIATAPVSALGILGYAVVMATVAALVDESVVEELNHLVGL